MTGVPSLPELSDALKQALQNVKLKNAALVAVMGATGSGKSTFINKVSGTDEMVTGSSLESCTDQIQFSSLFKLNGRDVCLIDTPGFDDTNKKDVDILQHIGGYIGAAYENGVKLAGVLYLHRISDNRVSGVTKRNLRVFHKLCGPEAMKNVVVVTTRWDRATEQEGASRISELQTNRGFLGEAVSNGAVIVQHRENTTESARKILSELLAKSDPVPLQIQTELVDEHRDLVDTAAGAELNSELKAQIKQYQEEIRMLREEMRERQLRGDRDIADLREEINEMNKAKKRAETEREKMRVDLEEIKKRADTGK
ncbi:hypothetical protein D9757_013410 [Collybiopsis confluens]|uniref:AIG1-type G domain-containing protein n=1 Tax=Collybiopsis confluens TaxID=2823264 RepID=A0A8H5D880_9AGAR|nr:hypothetical protein D9757_013410 [Collybiopsis confluens]